MMLWAFYCLAWAGEASAVGFAFYGLLKGDAQLVLIECGLGIPAAFLLDWLWQSKGAR